MESREHCHKM
ncbi:unnamed protein product, partial [Didymodactylos carnosus]